MKTLAEEQDYTFTSQVDWYTSYLKNFHFFEIRSIERKSNVLTGTYDDLNMSWEIADVTFSEGASFNAEVFNTTVMILRTNKTIPVFSMEKEGVFEKIFDRVMALTGYREIDFKMYSDISKEFLVMGKSESRIRSFFSPEVVKFMETHQLYHLESNGEALLIFDKVKLARTDETMAIIEYGKELSELLGTQESDT